MALVYKSAAFAADPAAPGTHALLIGVGKYPHLLGGDADIIDDPMGLRQLESPPVSAKTFADWLIPKVNPSIVRLSNPDAALATVELLLSPDETYTSPAGQATTIEDATRDNIQFAFDRWLARLESAPGSVAVFYFCGHGIMSDKDMLLASDFGSTRSSPWVKAFDVSTTVRALKRRVNCPLFFFVDACRQISRAVAETIGATAAPLCTARLSQPVLAAASALIYAAAEGAKAYAKTGPTVSRFTAALILALSGHVGRQLSNSARWAVTGSVLANGIVELLKRESGPGVPEQSSEQDMQGIATLHTLDAPPRVLVALKVSPDLMADHSSFSLRHIRHGVQPCVARNGTWETEVVQGEWDVGVASPTSAFPDKWLLGEQVFAPCYMNIVPVP